MCYTFRNIIDIGGQMIMKKLLIGTFVIALFFCLLNNADATNQNDIDITEDSFVVLDENGNPVIVEVEDTFDEKEYEEGLEEVKEQEDTNEANNNTEESSQMSNQSVIQPGYIMNPVHLKALVGTTESSHMARASYANHIVRFKTYAELGDTITYTEIDTGRDGYIGSNYSNDAAYISTNSDGSVICKLGGVVMKVPGNCVKSIVPYTDGNVSYYYVNEGKLFHYYSYISGSTVKMAVTRVGYKPGYLSNNAKYYSYDGHYFYSSFASMITDYKNYSSNSHANAINKNEPYYNYYQYLSLRSKTAFSASELNSRTQSYCGSQYSSSKMNNQGQTYINNQNIYGINAALMYGVSFNESAGGTSSIAKNKNNIFGLNAVDSSPSQSANYFRDVNQCIKEFAYDWMSTGYLNGTSWKYRGPHLGDKHSGINVKYASDPYWGEKAAAQSYYIADTTGKDYGSYKIGISSSTELSLYKEANTSARIYTSGVSGSGKKGYLYDYPVLILGTSGSFYKVQSDMPLKADRSARNVTATYDYNRDYVYAETKYISNSTNNTPSTPTYPKGDVNGDGKVSSLDYIQVKNHIMSTKTLSGDALSRADVNGDGKVTSLDYIKIKNHIMGTSLLS